MLVSMTPVVLGPSSLRYCPFVFEKYANRGLERLEPTAMNKERNIMKEFTGKLMFY